MSDTTSPLYPGRPIRPLPKKKLRSRLSPEQAESIVFPQAPPASKPLFFPFNEPSPYTNGVKGDAVPDGLTIREERSPETYGDEIKDEYQFRGIDLESDEEDGIGMLRRYQEQRHNGAPAYRSFVNGGPHAEIAKYPKPPDTQPAPSSADSVDGYDSFENTNNKKKRKIPTSGILGNHHSSLSADMAQMGISSPRDSEPGPLDGDGGVGQYYGSGSSAIPAGGTGTGISGAGRGRFGRSGTRNISGRSPLGVSTNGSNVVNSARSVPQRRENGSVGGITNKEFRSNQDQGIISAAIANAAALPSTPSKGQENVSLFEQQASKIPSSAKTQFTFTCESDSSRGMTWAPPESPSPSGLYQASAATNGALVAPPPPHPLLPPQASATQQSQRGFSTQGTQTSPTMTNTPQAPGQPRRPRRSPAKQAARAARQRRLQQELKNYHHPPNKEDIWICEFCEYESIFGAPPEALMRQYEIKDRQERRRLAEKRRLLEKAKMKGKKGKKGAKNSAKNSNAATVPQQPASNAHYDQQLMDQVPMQHQGTQSEEYLADDYNHDQIALPPTAQSKIPQPANQQHNFCPAVGEVHGGRAPVGRAT